MSDPLKYQMTYKDYLIEVEEVNFEESEPLFKGKVPRIPEIEEWDASEEVVIDAIVQLIDAASLKKLELH